MNYASTSNIREVLKFYNLGNKSFETDLSFDLAGRLLLTEATPIQISGGTLSHLTHKGGPSENRNFSQKYCPHSAGPKNIGKGCECLKILFIDKSLSVLTHNYQILKIFSIDPKVLNSAKNFDPKISYGRPHRYSAQVIPPPGIQMPSLEHF